MIKNFLYSERFSNKDMPEIFYEDKYYESPAKKVNLRLYVPLSLGADSSSELFLWINFKNIESIDIRDFNPERYSKSYNGNMEFTFTDGEVETIELNEYVIKMNLGKFETLTDKASRDAIELLMEVGKGV